MTTAGAGQIYRWHEEAVPRAGSQRSLDSQDTTLSRRGLIMMVSKRNKLLKYLARTSPESYQKLIGKLGLRK